MDLFDAARRKGNRSIEQENRLAAGVWRKASSSANNGSCVEVAQSGAAVLARDSKNPNGHVLGFRPDVWRAFVSSVKAGRHDLH